MCWDNYLEQSAFFGWMCQILSNIHAKDHRNKSNGIVVYPGQTCHFDNIEIVPFAFGGEGH